MRQGTRISEKERSNMMLNGEIAKASNLAHLSPISDPKTVASHKFERFCLVYILLFTFLEQF